MTTLMFILGIVVFVIGLAFSIAWHELGHFSTAKLFGVRVPQFMVGFGPTIWSKKRGETEYGVKAIPLGGYIRMIGMIPPGPDGRIESRSTSPWRVMIEDARAASFEELQPGDEDRLFYRRKPWKRVIVMFAGPFMNLILAFVIFLGVMMTFGAQTSTTTVSKVSDCVISASENRSKCKDGDKEAPAKAAGLKPGDRIVAFDGTPVEDWSALQADIRDNPGKQVTLTVDRGGEKVDLTPTLIKNQVSQTDGQGGYVKDKYVYAGWLGFTPASDILPLSFGQSVDRMGDMMENGVESLLSLPAKVPALWDATFGDGERAADSPMGVVGAARVGGEIFTMDIPATQQLASFLILLAGFNLSLFLFNMLPLLPLDGGHIAGALWESLRRNTAKVLRRPDPGPFDVAKLMPVAYVVAGIFVCFTLLVLIADLVNPVRIS
ncbi:MULTISPECIES: M50 family metallopeptidase [Streptomyces]|uniref:Membrane-associated protease RseP (Regulator of RpoE activity) n=1 Tax=Streptomyces stelliscabiei TaxID=146820 RepID=A0A8I0PDG6_9ACTN|nr:MULTISPECIES: site-2 protease family protein [Streptomyces]KND42250.1 zinc metalloprotease [Streptomyces stelliscabiei]MBE1600616.1 membrane-associated protease RseP (regulator of RpoE activity) [Streptomyces stelliscabiei]MDX2522433.1 site-2 protease family protein [Streptomyces stelliscabiei]MDX2554328.1 site-2 protease family protein [Streptomyces stelliscabiei]MDX2613537.1 site-2 protease family protein [Streptomyces stelliscabiei]